MSASTATTSEDALGDYRRTRSESAFRHLVAQHLALVWSVARRVTNGDTAMAEDVTQAVFTDFARLAPHLPPGMPPGGWLHRHAFFTASKAVRTEARRRSREHTAAIMHDAATPSCEPDDLWPRLAPHVDAALASLSTEDRNVIVQRFLERKSLHEISLTLDTSEDAARKRVARALEKLREKLRRRGIQVSAAALVSSLAAHAIELVPVGFAGSIAGTAWAAHAAAGSAGLAGALSGLVLRWGAGKLAALGATGMAVVVTGLVWFSVARESQSDRAVGIRDARLLTDPVSPPSAAPVNSLSRAELSLYFLPDREAGPRLLRFRAGVDDATLFEGLGPPEATGGRRWEIELTPGGHGGLSEGEALTYPTEFEYDGSGNPTGGADKTRLVGTVATLTVSDDPSETISRVRFTFEHHLSPPTSQQWPVSLVQGPDRPSLGPTQPIFHVLALEGSLAARPGDPVLAASVRLSPTVDPPPAGPRRALLFITLDPVVTQ